PTLHAAMLRKHLMALVFGPHGRACTDSPAGGNTVNRTSGNTGANGTNGTNCTNGTNGNPGTNGTNGTASDGAPSASEGGPDGGRSRDRTPTKHRMGLAFLHYLETRPEDTVPSAGGVPATVVVSMELETLRGGLKAASLDTGDRISAGEARRLACRAGIIPLVLGGPSVALDVGRKSRFHSEAQRIAMGVRDGGCRAAGCDAPPALTEAHHATLWSEGGGTSVEDGFLLCGPHHHRIHDPAFQHSLDKHGKVRFSRRT
ncbi:MAG TPA: DUF222 domain-containing protein, partial [Nocardioides sp.]